MSGSFKKIDYSLRPSKYAERRMLKDVFRRVGPFEPAENYLYVGFGSVWFADFVLFHRSLGIRDMISIEGSKSAEQRVRDNAPFRIDLRFDRAAKVLPKLPWDRRQLVWLDYDDALTPEMLLDVRTLTRNLRSGSVIAVSVQCSAAREFLQATGDTAEDSLPAIERFRERFSTAQIPADTFEEDLSGWPFAKLIHRMITGEIEDALVSRNRKEGEDPIEFRRICAFNYADGAMMTTLVGMVVAQSEASKFEACDFASLEFVEEADAPTHISVPKLTIKELRALERQLPLQGEQLELGSIPQTEATSFHKHYRYLPNFAVLEN